MKESDLGATSDVIPEFFFEGEKETTENICHNNALTGTRNWHVTVKFSSVTIGANLQSYAA
jgi:hypothetical protein